MAKPDLAAARAQLSPEARAELARRLRGGGAAAATIPRLAAGATAPLSTSQERLWLIEQLLPGTAAYNIPIALRIRGALDGAALKRSLDELIRRHAILRTVFAAGEQRVLPQLALALPVRDLRGLAPEARAAAEADHVRAVATQPFDLARGPLLRAELLWLAPREHVLALAFHHIVCDGESVAVAVRDLGALYQAFVRGVASPLPALAIQYADYAAWQRAEATRPGHAAALDRWQAELAGAPAWLELATDAPRPAVPSLESSTVALEIPAEIVAPALALGRGEGATPFMVVLAALQAVLVRHTGQRDLVVGAPISTRSRAELEPLLGFFVNTLPLRAQIAIDASFRRVLAQVRARVLAAFAGRDVAFEHILERLGLRAEAGRVPLSEVMFAYEEPVAAPALDGNGLTFAWEDPDVGAVHMDLVVRARPTANGGLRLTAIFRRGLWRPERIAGLLGHVRNLLAAAAAAPDAQLAQLAVLDGDEVARLIGWAMPARGAEPSSCLHRAFEAAADRAPDACAVIAGDRALSYAALDAEANQLAHALIAAGIGREAIVAVAVPRSERLAIAMLAIWKAGAVYLPLEPSDPADRLARLVTGAGAQIVIGDAPIAGVANLEAWADQPRHRPAPDARDVRPADAAYVIFTSGSTGEAKGVVVEHGALANQAAWKARACGLTPADRLLHAIPHTFDPSIWDFIGPLACGASLVVTPPGAHRDPALLLALAARHAATVLDVSLAMLQAILEAAEASPDAALAVRHIFCGGDAMPPDVPARVARVLGAELFNQYGPTEATIDACAWRCDPAARGPVPIGRPIDGARVYLLDDARQLVPAGAIGEICIAGAGVARGYLGDAARTASRFVADPHGAGRMYCTGDLGRLRDDGAIEFLGRRDHQVKIRGVRIELGEVEARLAGHPNVREVVVLARRDGEGGDAAPRLVAYVVPHAGPLAARDLRSFARAQLADAMVPSAFVVLAAMPINGNGKLDRQALPAPAVVRDTEYVAPRTPTEQRIAAVFAAQLGAERIGTLDQFLELGGHSLMAIRAAAELRVPVRMIFEHASVAELAAAIDQLDGVTWRAIPARPAGAEAPLSHQQRFIWSLGNAGHAARDCNVSLAVRFTGALDADALERAIGDVIARHASLRTVFTAAAQVARPFAGFTLARLTATEAELAELARREAEAAFDLSRDVLLRGPLVRIADNDHALLLTTHRIVYDGASLRVLARELITGYVAHHAGHAPSPAPLVVQYADYAAWQATVAAAPVEPWVAALAPTTAAAASRLAPALPGVRNRLTVPASLVGELRAFATAHRVTPFMTVLAALQLALAATGVAPAADEALWIPVVNRDRAELEPVIGRFVNLMALRVAVPATATLAAALDVIRAAVVDAFAQPAPPFERVIAAAGEAGRALPRVMLNLVDAPIGAIDLPGLRIAPLPALEPSAELPLAITAELGADALSFTAVHASADIDGAAVLAALARGLALLISHPDRTLRESVRCICQPTVEVQR
ncbi:MAG TPA: amino acid adenylation domain-containing protein [Kofleriaceae bacterium]|nr:amino acid adenylation domain-containing protein [Kofleriaceae bacterium]